MMPDAFIDRMLEVPYCAGGDTWAGADCWGVVELYYRHVLGIALAERGNISPGCNGLQLGFDHARHWQKIDLPENHCLVLMRARGFVVGHIGVYFNGHVLHSDERPGCVFQPISNRFIRTMTTGYYKYK